MPSVTGSAPRLACGISTRAGSMPSVAIRTAGAILVTVSVRMAAQTSAEAASVARAEVLMRETLEAVAQRLG